MPTFNLRGQDKINTLTGCIVSLMLISLTLVFASQKALHLVDRYNPDISQLLVTNAFTELDVFNTKEEKFRLAFTLEDYLTSKLKADPRYIKFFVRRHGKKNGVSYDESIPFAPCTEADMNEFLTPEPGSVDLGEALASDPDRGLYCVNWDGSNINLQGNENKNTFEILEVMVLPCNMKLTTVGDTEDRIPDDCIADLDEQIAYLGPLNFII